MKILVYGMGVIGGYLAHLLCTTENEVTVLARGAQQTVLERDGLVCRSYFGRRRTVDHPRVIGALVPDDRYDVIFAVMQFAQMNAILPCLAANSTPAVVLVGNNMTACEMESYLHVHSTGPKTVIFGFQATGGERKDGHYTYVSFGRPALSAGSTAPADAWQGMLQTAFAGAKYSLSFETDMDGWYKNHLAFILPICFVCYKYDCNLRRASRADIEAVMNAALEGYRLLEHLGYAVAPSDLACFGKKRGSTRAMLQIMAKTKMGELAATNHARHAVSELCALNRAFDALRAQEPSFPMPVWDILERFMPEHENE